MRASRLMEDRSRITAPNDVGKEALDWFVKHGLLPYTPEEMAVLSQRELDHLWAFYPLEQHRNRDLPEIDLSGSGEEYRQRLAETDEMVRNWLVEQEIITIPDHIPED